MTDPHKEAMHPSIDPLLVPQVQAYPYMFAGPFIELVMYPGWHAPFAKLCDDIDAALGENKRGFRWSQLKEKFGQPRWYWEMDGQSDLVMDIRFAPAGPVKDQPPQVQPNQSWRKPVPGEVFVCIRQLVDTASAACDWRCAVCGEPGSRRSIHGWLQLLCDEHAKAQGCKDPTIQNP